MKKLILWGAMAATAATTSVWGLDLNPNCGKAQSLGISGVYPWNLNPRDLYLIGDNCGDLGLIDEAYDGECWNYADPNNPKRPFLFMFYIFRRPSGYTSGDLKWRIWGNSGFETKLWLWNKTTQTWIEIDSVSGTNPAVRTYSGIPSSCFNEDNELYVMATVQEGVTTHNIIADRIDIQW